MSGICGNIKKAVQLGIGFLQDIFRVHVCFPTLELPRSGVKGCPVTLSLLAPPAVSVQAIVRSVQSTCQLAVKPNKEKRCGTNGPWALESYKRLWKRKEASLIRYFCRGIGSQHAPISNTVQMML